MIREWFSKYGGIQLAFVMFIAVASASMGIMFWQLQNQISENRDQAEQIAAFGQVKCLEQNRARIQNNREVRQPLRRLLLTFAELSRQSADNIANDARRREILALAQQFEQDGSSVTILERTACEFDRD